MMFNVVLLIILILINGLATGIEMSTISLDIIELKRRVRAGDKRAKKIYSIKEDPSGFLATTQICVTLTSLLASAFAAETFASYFLDIMQLPDSMYNFFRNVLVIIITLILSYITLVFGELLPKKIGMNNPEEIAYDAVGIVQVLMKIFKPFIWVLTKSTNLFMKLFRIKEAKDAEFDEEELKKLIVFSRQEGVIDHADADYGE